MLIAIRQHALLIAACLSIVAAAGCGGSPTAPGDGGGTTIAGTVDVQGGGASLPGGAAGGLTVSIVGTNMSTTVEDDYFQLRNVPSGTVRLLFKDAVVNATVDITNVGGEALIEIEVEVERDTATIVNEARTDHRVSLCHRSDERYHMITVSESAEPAHRAHGDGEVGDEVPGRESMTFDENCQPSGPAVEIQKSTNGHDADSAPGPDLTIGSPVSWTYVVSNTGTVPLSGISVVDDQGVVVSCPATSLAPGTSMTCTGSGTAIAGQYSNVGTVTATPPSGPAVSDSDASHYFGEEPEEETETEGEKVDVCHRTGAGFYVLINISVNALQDHLNHGDGRPGQAVPDGSGRMFSASCSIN